MKLASYKDGSRDGQLVVVSRDLGSAHYATAIATRLQQVLDDWNFLSPQLEDLYSTLNQGKARHAFPFDPALCMAPLPRAFQWAQPDPAAPREGATPALVHQPGDGFLGPRTAWRRPAAAQDEGWAVDLVPGLAALTGDVPMGATAHEALEGVRLLLLAGSVVLRHPQDADDAADAARAAQAWPATAFGPVAVTPDEAGDAWQGGRLHLPLELQRNGRRWRQDLAQGMPWHLGELVAAAARWRPVHAGSIVGCSVQAPDTGGDAPAERHAAEAPEGDRLRIALHGAADGGLLGAIECTLAAAGAGR